MVDPNKDFLADISKFKPLAHHPDCDRYSNHLLWIFGHPICLGCFCVFFGLVFCIVISFLYTPKNIAGPQFYILGVMAYLPTLAQVRIHHKTFKIISRFMLGISIAFLLGSVFFINNWDCKEEFVWKVVALFNFIIVLKMTLKIRNRFIDNPCSDCNRGRYPFCTHKLKKIKKLYDVRQKMLENSKFADFIEEIIKKLEQKSSNRKSFVEFETLTI